MTIGVVDVGLGNITAVHRMLSKVGSSSIRLSKPSDMQNVDKIVLPGVGHFLEGVERLKDTKMDKAIKEFAKNSDRKILGICLGMQLLCNHSEEANLDGLGLVEAKVKKIQANIQKKIKVPHMGWNTVAFKSDCPLIKERNEEKRFYFVHSYKVVPDDPSVAIGITNYGGKFCSAFQSKNVFGVQFHPEKSHRFGMELLKSFVNI